MATFVIYYSQARRHLTLLRKEQISRLFLYSFYLPKRISIKLPNKASSTITGITALRHSERKTNRQDRPFGTAQDKLRIFSTARQSLRSPTCGYPQGKPRAVGAAECDGYFS